MANYSISDWFYDLLRNHEHVTAEPEWDEQHCLYGEIAGQAIVAQPDIQDKYVKCTALDMSLKEFADLYTESFAKSCGLTAAEYAYSDLEGRRSKTIHLWNHDHNRFEIRSALSRV